MGMAAKAKAVTLWGLPATVSTAATVAALYFVAEDTCLDRGWALSYAGDLCIGIEGASPILDVLSTRALLVAITAGLTLGCLTFLALRRIGWLVDRSRSA